MKLELKHLSPYLPYGLKIAYGKTPVICEMTTNQCSNDTMTIDMVLENEFYQPILIPITDLNEYHPAMIEINKIHTVSYNAGNTFVELENECDSDPYSVEWLPNACVEILVKHHIDVFGSINKGLAIDINTL